MDDSTATTAGLYLPVQLDLNSYPSDYRGVIAYLLDLIHRKSCAWRADPQGFVRLKHEYLLKAIPQRLWSNLLRDYLQSGGETVPGTDMRYPTVLETSEYVQGASCRGYRLAPAYRDVARAPCPCPKLAAKLKHVEREQDAQLLPVHKHLRAWLGKLEFDHEQAKSLIETMEPDQVEPKWAWERGDFYWQETLPVQEYRWILSAQAQRLADKHHHFTVDEFGRVHTPVTSLPKELRQCLSVQTKRGAEPLVWLDLKNSQPLMAVMLAMAWHGGDKMVKSRLRRQEFNPKDPYKAALRRMASTSIRSGSGSKKMETRCYYVDDFSTKLEKTLQKQQNLTDTGHPDLRGAKHWCEQGVFYESFMPENAPDGFRDRFKVRMFRDVFFGGNGIRSSVKTAFNETVPSIASMLHDLKRQDKGRAAWLLQNYESTIFIAKICGRLRRDFAHVPIFTIHDCIGTVPKYVELVRSIILDEFAALGIHPTLGVSG